MQHMTNPPSSTRRSLNQKQKHFLDRYHITGDLGQSWIDAGYNCTIESASSNASRVLQREDAQEYLQSLQKHSRQRTGLTAEKLLDRLEQIIDSPDARDRDVIQAIREAGRMIGAYQPKPEPKEPVRDTLHEFIKRVRAQGSRRAETEIEPPVETSYEYQQTPETPPAEEPPIHSTPEPTPVPHHVPQRQSSIHRQPLPPNEVHPHYNPYYDPTIPQRKPIKVIRPGQTS
ncbi:MAG: hypothetical protein CMO55_15780 [Verrucomicrobiales bacterium]|nr:hypothetical protein [Verrucomicrobiales bacterium]